MTDEPLTDDELGDIVLKEITSAENYCDGDVGTDRALALSYYDGHCDLESEEGRSSVVSTDVRDTIDSLLPPVLDIFLSAQNVVEAQARRPETEQQAQAATSLCNYVFHDQNDGGTILQSFLFDGVVCKNGFLKAFWDKTETVTEQSYEGLSEVELNLLKSEEAVEIIAETQTESGFDVTIKVSKEAAQVRIVPVPTDEVIVSPKSTAQDPEYVPFIAHRQRKTLQSLIEMGYDRETLEQIGSTDDGSSLEADARERGYRGGFSVYKNSGDDYADWTKREITYYECYYTIDADRDGRSELRKVCMAGKKVLHNSITSCVPIITWTPKPRPHEYFGDCPADEIIEIQDLKTFMLRNTNDNIALSNSPRTIVDESAMIPGVTLSDLLNTRPGALARVRGNPAASVQVQPTAFVAEQTFGMLQYLDEMKEARSGVSKVTQGLDADALNKQTATGMRIVENNSQLKVKRYSRNLGYGLIRLFKVVLLLLRENQKNSMMIRLNGGHVDIDPQVWSNDYDFRITVGLGTGNKDQMLMHLNAIQQAQAMAMQAGMSMLVSPKELYNTQRDIIKNSGLNSPEKYWKDPGDAQPQPPPPPPDPVKIQQEIEAVKNQGAQQLEAMRQQAKDRDSQRDKELEIFKFGQAKQLELAKAQLQQETARIVAQINAGVDIETNNTKARTELVKAKIASFQTPETMQQQLDGVGLTLDEMPVEPDRPSILPVIEQLAQAVAMLAASTATTKSFTVARDANGLMIGGAIAPSIQ